MSEEAGLAGKDGISRNASNNGSAFDVPVSSILGKRYRQRVARKQLNFETYKSKIMSRVEEMTDNASKLVEQTGKNNVNEETIKRLKNQIAGA